MARKQVLVAGVDAAADACTVIVRDVETWEVVRRGRATCTPGFGPREWWTTMLAAVADAGQLTGVSALAVAALPGVVLLDGAGAVLDPARTPREDELAAAAAGLVAEVGAAQFAERTGFVPTADAPIAFLRWLRDADPDTAARVDAVCAPHDWLTWRLRGFGAMGEGVLGPQLEELATDRSEISTTGWWNPATGRHEHALLNTALGHAAIKPRVMRADGWGGESVKLPDAGIRTGCIIGVGGRRRAAAAFALDVRPGEAIVFAGEGGNAVVAVSESPVHDESGVVQGFADLSGVYLPEVSVATCDADRVVAAVDALRAASVPVTGVLIAGGDQDASACGIPDLSALSTALGVPVTRAPAADHVADGMAAQAAWALTRRRIQTRGASDPTPSTTTG